MAKPTLSEISKLFKTDDKPTDFHYYGTVVSADVENRTYEVSINRDENITVEAARLVGAHVGDTVMVTVMANGYATVTGRVGGDTDASDAQRKADTASTIADQAQTKAISALSTATEAEQLANQAKQLADQAERNASRSADAAYNSEQSAQESAESAARSATAADTAEKNAAASKTAAETAQQNAQLSEQAAHDAENLARDARTYASNALVSADNANKASNAALNSVSIVEDVAGTLKWIQDHGHYVISSDSSVVEGTVYFTYNYETQDYEPITMPDPDKNPMAEGWYVLDITDSQTDYINNHLAVTNRGLWVLPVGRTQDDDYDPQYYSSQYKILLANDGMYVYDESGVLVSTYGEDITFDSLRPQTIGNKNQYIKYYQDEEDGEYKIAINAQSISLGSSNVATVEEMMQQADDAQAHAEASAKAYADDALESFTSRFTVSPEEISSEVSGFQDGNTIVSRINQLPDSVKIEAKNVEIIDKYESYIELAADEANPYILLGKRDNNAMLLRITNERMGFEVNSEEVAYLAPDALHVQKQISFGDFIMKQRENGHLSIIRTTRGE